MKNLICIIMLSFFSASCMVHANYPVEWGERITIEDNKCPDVSGVYMNYASPNTLARILGFDLGEISGMYLKINQKGNTFWISGCEEKEGKLVCNPPVMKKYSCTSEGIKTASYKKSIFRPEGFSPVGYAYETFYLTKTKDGHLIVKESGSVIGTFVIPPWPIIGFGTEWRKFKLEELK